MEKERTHFSTLSKNSRQGYQKCILRVHGIILTFFERFFKVFFEFWATFSLAFCWKVSGGVVKTAFYASLSPFWHFVKRISFFWNLSGVFLALCWKEFCDVVKTALSVSMGTFSRKVCCFWKQWKLLALSEIQPESSIFQRKILMENF